MSERSKAEIETKQGRTLNGNCWAALLTPDEADEIERALLDAVQGRRRRLNAALIAKVRGLVRDADVSAKED